MYKKKHFNIYSKQYVIIISNTHLKYAIRNMKYITRNNTLKNKPILMYNIYNIEYNNRICITYSNNIKNNHKS